MSVARQYIPFQQRAWCSGENCSLIVHCPAFRSIAGLTNRPQSGFWAARILGDHNHRRRAKAADRLPDSRRALDRPFQFRYIVGMTSKTIETRAHTTKDGRLNLSVDVDVADVDVAAVVTVTPVMAGSPVDENGWPEGFFDHVAGSMPGLRRGLQGDFEERLPLE
jgi:hypothetical protein